MANKPKTIQAQFGNMDIYLFDQLLKGRFDNCRAILDAGCGSGRNLVYFLQQNVAVYGIDQRLEAIEAVRQLSQRLNPNNSPQNFVLGELDAMPYGDASFDLVICNAVLHFADNEAHFDRMLRSLWRVLQPGGYLLVRLASDIGIEASVKPLGDGRYLLPDGSTRFLVNEQLLLNYTKELGGQLFEYIKTTNVQNLRCMTTWCVQKL